MGASRRVIRLGIAAGILKYARMGEGIQGHSDRQWIVRGGKVKNLGQHALEQFFLPH